MSTMYHPLTEHNLSLHNQSQHQDLNPPVPTRTWIDSLIASERTHLFTTQLALSLSNLPPINIDIDADLQHITDLPHSPSLKLFEHTHHQTMHQETPLERFLTPGYSDPCYVVKSALAGMGVQFGSLEGGEARRKMARENVEVVRVVSASAGGSTSEGS
ncbi:uncharacterized protein BO80DRAFT_423357 [Aspergillus ibericus CBS 121593]|uniref:Uncharacterized protein n=1 Tax=Aspergillus ibericus CBS 121593 TaxID=1448316 RepID=A0A395H5E8_9EURO|nr:hypothetical protein BO80DRAFT_423357 [Aspergillus ibericus CBS 121593]RAL02906.1 hypothetical protein BO80DRAFT_423357 [Aspergillus ibericus CBS 121593]